MGECSTRFFQESTWLMLDLKQQLSECMSLLMTVMRGPMHICLTFMT